MLILITVVALAGAALLINVLSKSNRDLIRERKTLVAMSTAKDALIGFAMSNGRLPRPATSATNGVESPIPCTTEESCTGFLPWVTLGIERADSWGKLLRYSVTPIFTVAPIMRTSAVPTKTVLGRSNGGEISYTAGNPNCSLSTPCLPAIIYSNGKDNFGTSEAGVELANVSRTNIDEAANNVASVNFMRRAANPDPTIPGGEFDDLLTWIPIELLYKRMGAAKVLP